MQPTARRNLLREFLRTESAGGAVLVVAAAAALVWANSPWSASYESLWNQRVWLDLRHWVNEAAMAVFFLVVGLEIRREVTGGHLAGRRAMVPIAAAAGGMVVPAVLYLAIAGGTAPSGWGVPMATDIALAVGVLALAGRGAPAGLRAFLLGLAVADDIAAIVVIALVYSDGVRGAWLAAAGVVLAVVVVARRRGVTHLAVYLATGIALWVALHHAGVHPTLAGVAMGLLAPVGEAQAARLHPWTSFLVVPLFALANAGIEVSEGSLRHALDSPVAWGVFVGLAAGKPLGVVVTTLIAFRTRVGEGSEDTSVRRLVGAGHAAGIGFTVALFVAELAFDDPLHVADAKMAILAASVLSGALALAVLRQRRSPMKLS